MARTFKDRRNYDPSNQTMIRRAKREVLELRALRRAQQESAETQKEELHA